MTYMKIIRGIFGLKVRDPSSTVTFILVGLGVPFSLLLLYLILNQFGERKIFKTKGRLT